MDPTTQTQKSYKIIAEAYLKKNQERSLVTADLFDFMARLPAHGRVLDLGCGPGFDTAVFQQQGFRAIGIDLSWEMLHTGQERFGVPLVQADFRHLPLPKIDGVWACASLLHLPHAAMPAALHEIYRVLSPGGQFYLSLKWGTEAGWEELSYGQAAPRFFAYWTPETLDPLLIAAGFRIWQASTQPHPESWLTRFAST